MSEPATAQNTEKALKRSKASPSSAVITSSDSPRCECGPTCNCAEQGGSAPARKFACPYSKRYPDQRPSSTSCAYPGFPTIFRLKEHLYRKHKSSDTKCSRCHLVFETEVNLQDHQRVQDICEIRELPETPGFSKEQEKQLRSRKRSPGCMSEEEKWKEVYRILFPEHKEDPMPYVERRTMPVWNFERYQVFSRQALRDVLSSKLGIFDDSSCCNQGQQRKRNVLDIVMKCQEQVFQEFVGDKPAGLGENSTSRLGSDCDGQTDLSPISPSINGKCLEMDCTLCIPALRSRSGTPKASDYTMLPGADNTLDQPILDISPGDYQGGMAFKPWDNFLLDNPGDAPVLHAGDSLTLAQHQALDTPLYTLNELAPLDDISGRQLQQGSNIFGQYPGGSLESTEFSMFADAFSCMESPEGGALAAFGNDRAANHGPDVWSTYDLTNILADTQGFEEK